MTIELPSANDYERASDSLGATIANLSNKFNHLQANVFKTVPFVPSPEAIDCGSSLSQVATEDFPGPLGLMGYPFKRVEDFEQQDLPQIAVGVWDYHVDGDHCDFKSSVGRACVECTPTTPDPLGVNPIPRPRIPTCNQMFKGDGYNSWDHGTHVAGIIAARINGYGIVGANPRSLIWGLDISQGFANINDPFLTFARHSAIRIPTVINLSIKSEAPDQTYLQSLVTANFDKYLFVAAAGNDGREMGPGKDYCSVIPACMSYLSNSPNVISVAALDAEGKDRWPDSNWGQAFDVAALGIATSLFHGNYFSRMCGSSVAAPYVSGLASLIYSKAMVERVSLQPAQVKERIEYTTDISDTLVHVARFGRINYERALDFTSDLVNGRAGLPSIGDQHRYLGKHRWQDSVTIEEGIEDDSLLPRQSIKLSQIKRISAQADGQSYWLILRDPSSGKLRRWDDVKFSADSRLRFDDAKLPKEIPISNIDDFVSAITKP